MFDFNDKVVIITGAAGNLGAGVAGTFLNSGARLVLVDRSPDRLRKMFPELAGSERHYLAASVDLNDAVAVEAAVKSAFDKFGRIDALINTAGGYRAGTPLHETPPEDWDFLINLNARSVFTACRAVIPYLLRNGSGKIVNVSSRAANAGERDASIYSVSKTAVVRLTESMAAELKENNINVNCVLPGMIDTPPNRQAMPGADFSRWVKVEDLANVIAFLTSDLAVAINGAAVPVYGRG